MHSLPEQDKYFAQMVQMVLAVMQAIETKIRLRIVRDTHIMANVPIDAI